MREFYSNELLPGKTYRIEHKRHILSPRLGRFIRSYLNPINTHNDFDTIVMNVGKFNTPVRISYGVKDWRFYETGDDILAEQAARGLCDRIPEDTAGIIYEFLTGPRASWAGPAKFPAR